MRRRLSVPPSPEFDRFAEGAQFRDRIAVPVTASPEAIFEALRLVTLRDMKVAWALGEIRYLPARLGRHVPPTDSREPFLSQLLGGGTLILRDDSPHELITGSAARLHRVNQAPRRFTSVHAFEVFGEPDHEKLFISIRVAPTGQPGQQWLVLEHATRALSPVAERKFSRYWRVIKPAGAFVSWLLLRAVRRKAEHAAPAMPIARGRRGGVRATAAETQQPWPGDELIASAFSSSTHAITIDRSARDVWPWLAQMGAGSRAGWYSYDALDNGRRRSAERIVPELQELKPGMIFPALPGITDCFTLLAFEPERHLILGWRPNEHVVMTWAFVLSEEADSRCRLIVRARVGPGYRVHALPWWLTSALGSVVHFVMQRKQLLGIKRRAESTRPWTSTTTAREQTARKDAA